MECIEHTGYCQPDGYGRKKYKGKVVLAHRLAYALANNLDVFTMGGVVMHSCDNPKCINPAHLRLGTIQENNADKLSKRRQWCKLSDADKQYILAHATIGTRHSPGTIQAVAGLLGVHREAVRAVLLAGARTIPTP